MSDNNGSAWDRYVHQEEVWGTVVTMDLRGPSFSHAAAQSACDEASRELHRIDQWLSPFRADSAVSLIRAGILSPSSAEGPVIEVIQACARITQLTNGAFDPWRARGGFDPSGFVKGWGADRVAAILGTHGFANVSVNAAGDVTCRGQSGPEVTGWRIGITDPRDQKRIITSVLVRDAHIATSARYEKGDHITDPKTARPVTSVDSASVLAREGGCADALATALFVSGPPRLAMLARQHVSAYLVQATRVWTTGNAFRDR